MGNCWGAQVKAESPTHSSPNNSGSGSWQFRGLVTCAAGGCGRCISRRTGDSAKPKSISQDGAISETSTQNVDSIRHSTSANLRSFTFSDLKAATRNFRPDSLLGEGGFGCVFKGWIDEHGFMATRPGTGIVIAVKKLNLEGFQGHKEWLAEVHFLGQLHHQNLVKLVGFCAEDDHRLLVYEFMPRGSLENHLFRRGSHNQPLSWAIRIKVAVGAAKGLAFLHDAEKPVIYRDFKTSNILLDSQYNAKLSDFGLAKDGPTGDNTHVSTRVMGTYGYAAPEYVATGHLTAKSDVYSFGVVLLEILTGRRAVDKNRPGMEQNLVEWALPYLNDKRRFFRLIDSRLEGQYSMKGAHRAAMVALSCLHPEAKLRPQMKEVVDTLEPLLSAREMTRYSSNYQGGFSHHGVRSQQNVNRNHHQSRSNASHPSPRNGITRTSNGASPLPASQPPKAGVGYAERKQD